MTFFLYTPKVDNSEKNEVVQHFEGQPLDFELYFV